eukprot:Clim_evm152s147 gene=Clim_evmTU152s147
MAPATVASVIKFVNAVGEDLEGGIITLTNPTTEQKSFFLEDVYEWTYPVGQDGNITYAEPIYLNSTAECDGEQVALTVTTNGADGDEGSVQLVFDLVKQNGVCGAIGWNYAAVPSPFNHINRWGQGDYTAVSYPIMKEGVVTTTVSSCDSITFGHNKTCPDVPVGEQSKVFEGYPAGAQ